MIGPAEDEFHRLMVDLREKIRFTNMGLEVTERMAENVHHATMVNPIGEEHTTHVHQLREAVKFTSASLRETATAAFLVDRQRFALKQELEQDRQAFEQEMVARRKDFEDEKERMRDMKTKPTDIIELNVRGRILQTTRATLCAAEDTLLAAMFSGRWEESVPRDKNGAVFLDFDSDLFGLLLNHLHALKEWQARPDGKKPSLPPVYPHQKVAWNEMLGYLGLQSAALQEGNIEAATRELANMGLQQDLDGALQPQAPQAPQASPPTPQIAGTQSAQAALADTETHQE